MDEYIRFEGCIEPLIWGSRTYTVLPLPDEVARALTESGARRVEGEIADHPVNLALSRAPVTPWTFLWTGKSLLDALGVSPGDLVEVRLRPAPDDAVDLPDDVAAALRSAGRTAAWEALTPGRRRAALYTIATARRAETRARRIAALLDGLDD